MSKTVILYLWENGFYPSKKKWLINKYLQTLGRVRELSASSCHGCDSQLGPPSRNIGFAAKQILHSCLLALRAKENNSSAIQFLHL